MSAGRSRARGISPPELSKEQPCFLLIVLRQQPGANVIKAADLEHIAADAIRRGDGCQGEFVVSGSLATLRSLELRASRAKLALPFARTT